MTAMNLHRYPSAGGGIALGKMGVWATMLKQGKTARDYVQDGLVAMWDGIENAGWGIHNPNATTWIPLVGNAALDIENGEWLSDAVQLTNGAIHNASIPELVAAVASGEYTIEYGGYLLPREGLVYGNESAGFKIGGLYNTTWAHSSTSTEGSCFWSKGNINSSSAAQPYPCTYESRWGWDDTMTNHRSDDSVAGLATSNQAGIGIRKCTNQYVGTGGDGWSYVDTNLFNAAKVNLQATYKNYGFALGTYRTAASASRSNMTYNFFRVYSRALTADEIAANYAIDKERFNLP